MGNQQRRHNHSRESRDASGGNINVSRHQGKTGAQGHYGDIGYLDEHNLKIIKGQKIMAYDCCNRDYQKKGNDHPHFVGAKQPVQFFPYVHDSSG
jgi:hypothetical protein